MKRILISDKISKEGVDLFRKYKDVRYDIKIGIESSVLKKIIKHYDALIVRSETKVTKDVIKAAKKLKVIGRAGSGVDNIDVDSATEHGIIVMNTPGGNTNAVAEHTMALILAISRNIIQAHNSLKQKKWERNKLLGVELKNKTIGIIGLGHIGVEVAKKANAFGMKVLGYDPYVTAEKAKELNIELTTLKNLCRKSDYITVHTPLTDKTKGMISDKEFKLMKKGVKIINAARGGIINESSLLKNLKNGKVSSAALDVFVEGKPFGSPLLNMTNVIVSPHLGASTKEAQVEVGKEVVEQVIAALNNEEIVNAVNLPSISREKFQILKPYIRTAEILGRIMQQLVYGKIRKTKISYYGNLFEDSISLIINIILKELISKSHAEINLVNAKKIAANDGITVVENKIHERKNYNNMIRVSVNNKEEIAISLFKKDKPTIVEYNNIPINSQITKKMLFFRTIDMPGVIGAIGTILGKNKVNIIDMHLGRINKRKEARTVLNIDEKIIENVIKQLLKHKYIKEVRYIKL